MSDALNIKVRELYVPLRTTFKQASSERKMSESIWAIAERGDTTGLGEGCPRPYVTGETVSSCLAWLTPLLPEIQQECGSFEQIKSWVTAHELEIDKHPAAWCAVESALLDLFARESGCSVEALLGLPDPFLAYRYSAVLSDNSPEKFAAHIDRFLAGGFSDFKIKLNGDLETDRAKLDLLRQKCTEKGLTEWRIRFDANNYWKGQMETAINHLQGLNTAFLGIEEPVAPKDNAALSQISLAVDSAVILDESLCNKSDLENLKQFPGKFIANIKVSRVGGILRALSLIESLKALGWQIIIGAHVGETSLMTRAGMCAANAAGSNIIAQEGAFGLLLLENEPVRPTLMFGGGGILDLTSPYKLKTTDGIIEIPTENWHLGWGLQKFDY